MVMMATPTKTMMGRSQIRLIAGTGWAGVGGQRMAAGKSRSKLQYLL